MRTRLSFSSRDVRTGGAGQTCEAARHEVAHVAVHKLAVNGTGRRNVGRVVNGDAMFVGNRHRGREQPWVGADESAVVSDSLHPLAQAMCRRRIPPGAHGYVGHFVVSEIQGGPWIAILDQADGVVEVRVAGVLACQQDAGIQELQFHWSGRGDLTEFGDGSAVI